MAETIETPRVNQYQNTMRILCQQKDSRLEGTTIPPVKIEGEYLYWERIGATEAVDLEVRHGDTPNIEVDHSRRRSTAAPKVWATLLDRADAARMLVDPKGPYQQTAKMAMNRAKDRIIIAALGGSAWAGKTGTTEVVLPASQKIAHSNVGLTLGKILLASEMLETADVDPEIERFIIASAQQKTNLLTTTEVKSTDYNSVKALTDGKINQFMGFTFKWLNLLTKTLTTRYCYAYTKEAIGFGTVEEITVRLSERVDKNYAWQPYVSMDMGASRIEEVQVIEIACTET
jgi:hypothetical protein